jgi:N-acetylneuraminic acid mutarotase
VYGTRGVASTSNIPSGRDFAVSWTDSSGNLWLFGGSQVDPLLTTGPLNDLWEYNPTSNEWTWVGGSNTVPGNQLGIYGTQGIAAATNVPGGHSGASSWVDGSSNLWLFGGGGFDSTGAQGLLNDLWEYSPLSKEWTWVSGSSTINPKAVYGALGAAGAANVPGARANAVSWTDRSGSFWLFGGDGVDSNGNLGGFNDLWEFNPSSKEWTWISGSTTANVKAVPGMVGVASASNVPGSRQDAISWADGSGNLWLFGGYGYDSTGTAYDLNDLWKFSPSSKEWTWISGSTTVTNADLCPAGTYGTEGTPATANIPGGRNSAVSWIDSGGNLWLFGGLGCDAIGTAGALNDLWEFDTKNLTWTWQSGSNSVGTDQGGTGGPSGVYGTEGTVAASNVPGGRSNAISWTDPSGTLWLFGGSGLDSAGNQGLLNDLWSYQP